MLVFSTVNLAEVEAEIKDSKSAVERLLDNEDKSLERFNEIAAIADQGERLEGSATLVVECEALASYAKLMEDTVKRAKKRMEGVKAKILEGIHDEVEKAGGSVETKNWTLKLRDNPAKVIVDELEAVPTKYKTEPDPVPPASEWPADKAMIKKALTKERVQSIKGVHLEQSSRVEVKPR